MWAANEQFRRFTYKSQMYLKGGTGGTCCMPTVGNAGHSCPCDAHKGSSFPVKQVFHPGSSHLAFAMTIQLCFEIQAVSGLRLPAFWEGHA